MDFARAGSAPPITTGTIGDSGCLVIPNARASRMMFASNNSLRPSPSVPEQSSSADTAAAIKGTGGAVAKMKDRARL